ncbi:uncharacterized protein LOC116010192 [Ipomoea triloba]|uniref:uncharacterized protein LOC116010192 n=1 Tax=Ipomoea triloba TaxID=35885 RepID=UPI00125E7406|nr:uncharacterized protein LOC116010192 [Ipomoea triloba]
MISIIWNCQGAGGKGFHRVLKNLIQTHRPDILGLVEPKVSGSQANVVCSKLGYSDWIRVEAVGFSGGIWVFWNSTLHVTVVHTHPQFVLLQVHRMNQAPWHYAIVYGSPTQHLRRRLWSELTMAKRGITGPCLIARDFNSVVNQDETNNYSAFSSQRSSDFVHWIQSEGLVDLGFSGPRYTWTKGLSVGHAKAARLDRALCNLSWRNQFPEATVTHLPRISSDHTPLLIRLSDAAFTLRRPEFKFQAAWLTSRQFPEVVHRTWNNNRTLYENIPVLTTELSKWNREVFRDINRRKKIVLARLGGVQTRLSNQRHGGLAKLEKKLTEEYQEILYQEELMWFQRSREDWIVSGDRNTAYYHVAATI